MAIKKLIIIFCVSCFFVCTSFAQIDSLKTKKYGFHFYGSTGTFLTINSSDNIEKIKGVSFSVGSSFYYRFLILDLGYQYFGKDRVVLKEAGFSGHVQNQKLAHLGIGFRIPYRKFEWMCTLNGYRGNGRLLVFQEELVYGYSNFTGNESIYKNLDIKGFALNIKSNYYFDKRIYIGIDLMYHLYMKQIFKPNTYYTSNIFGNTYLYNHNRFIATRLLIGYKL